MFVRIESSVLRVNNVLIASVTDELSSTVYGANASNNMCRRVCVSVQFRRVNSRSAERATHGSSDTKGPIEST